MRNKLSIIPLIGILILSGCVSFQDSAGKTLATTVQAVDMAMKGWAMYVAIGGATSQQESAVKAAYARYQVAEQIAEKAYVAAAVSGDQNGFTMAANTLRAVQADLLALIATFQTKGGAK